MEYVIFTSPISLISLSVAVALYVAIALTKRLIPSIKFFSAMLGIVNLILHVWILVLCLYIGASMQEILFVFVASSAFALTVTKQGKAE